MENETESGFELTDLLVSHIANNIGSSVYYRNPKQDYAARGLAAVCEGEGGVAGLNFVLAENMKDNELEHYSIRKVEAKVRPIDFARAARDFYDIRKCRVYSENISGTSYSTMFTSEDKRMFALQASFFPREDMKQEIIISVKNLQAA